MLIECKNCGFKQGDRVAVAFMLVSVLTGGGAILGSFLLSFQIGSWALLCFLPLWILLYMGYVEMPCILTYLRYGLKPYPQCSNKSWAWPRYSGWGL